MKDLVGQRGIKGEIGERGPPGKDYKCGCAGASNTQEIGFEIAESDKIISKSVSSSNDGITFTAGTSAGAANDITGSVIYKQEQE